MLRLPWRSPAPPHDDDQVLLQHLLHQPAPTRRHLARPVALHSTAQQRRLALRPFLRRTWVDHTLHLAERTLLLALLLVMGFWVLDIHGRDWLHAQQQRGAFTWLPAQAAAPVAPLVPAAPTVPDGSARMGALPVPVAVAPGTDLCAPGADACTTPPLPYVSAAQAAAPLARLPAGLLPGTGLRHQSPAVPVVHDPRPQRLIIPALNADIAVREVFVEGGAWQVADYAAGYHHGSALPGTVGNTVLAGHAGIRGAVFAGLGVLRPGDTLMLEAGGRAWQYRVREQISVLPTAVDVLAPTATPVLTLITCTAWDTRRLVVIADLVDSSPR